MLRWSSVRRRSEYWEPGQLAQRYGSTASTPTQTDAAAVANGGLPLSLVASGGARRAKRAMTMHMESSPRAGERRRDWRTHGKFASEQAHSVDTSDEVPDRPCAGGYRKYSLASSMALNSGGGGGPREDKLTPTGRGGQFALCASGAFPLMAIDDETEEEQSGAEPAAAHGDQPRHSTELLPKLPKSHSKSSGLRRASFCNEALQRDADRPAAHLNGGDTLLGVPDAAAAPSEHRFSISHSANAALALMRRRRSSFAREKWASKLEFLLAVIGYAVDLGNIWRFPSVCYKHGGGAFLIPYIVMLLVGGLPMFYMELVLGQFHRSGCLSIWKKICPMFKGIGYGICFICTFISCFYNAVIAHAVYFFISSVGWEVPWMRCNNTWNTKQCRESLNASAEELVGGQELRTPSQEFYLFSVLESEKSTGLDDLGGVKPSMAFCLFLVFLIVYFALWKGPRSTGKIVWVTATAPYVVLSILLVRGLTLPGASKGIYYYLMPDFDKLWEPTVWTAAATQIFFSLGPGFGVLLALSSYNDFNNNCYRDAVVTSVINCFTSFFSGFVIFSTLGYMSELTNRPVSEVVGEADSSLIFVVYPQAIATMNYSSIWSLIFFLMLITLGIDSTFSGIEALITGFCDEYPRLLARKREIFVAIVIVGYYIGSLPTVTYGGSYVIPFLDEYGVSLSVLFIVMCEMIAVCWFYGIRRFSEDIHLMLGFYPGLYWRVCWTCCPVFIGIIFVLALYSTSFQPMELPNYKYPKWSVIVGWIFRLLSCCSVPAYAIYMFLTTPGTFSQRIKFMLTAQPRRTITSAGASSLTLGGNSNCLVTMEHHHISTANNNTNSSNSNNAASASTLVGNHAALLSSPRGMMTHRTSVRSSRQSSCTSSSIAHL